MDGNRQCLIKQRIRVAEAGCLNPSAPGWTATLPNRLVIDLMPSRLNEAVMQIERDSIAPKGPLLVTLKRPRRTTDEGFFPSAAHDPVSRRDHSTARHEDIDVSGRPVMWFRVQAVR